MDALVQRDPEVAALARHLDGIASGAGRVVVVEGPAGIGKSSLLAWACRRAEADGLRVLRAWGSPQEVDAGWGIARQLMGPVRRGPDWGALAVGAAGLALGALDPQPERPVAAGDAMHAAAHGLTWLAYGLAERRPTVLVVDDVHWADVQSLRWLVHVAHQIGDLPLGIVCAVRSGEPAAEPRVLAELVSAAGRAVRPAPLDRDAVAGVVVDRFHTAAAGLVDAWRTTAGNPLLLQVPLDTLADDGAAPTDEVAAQLTTVGPPQVAHAVERQLARLPDGSAALAHAFAVLGRGAALRHAGQLADLDPDRTTTLLDGLLASGLLIADPDGWTLAHPLVAGALYTGLPAGRRAVLHGRAAAVLRQERGDPEAVALHLLHTEPFGSDDIVEQLRAAAERAGRRGAPDVAARFLRRALREPPSDRGVEADLRSELGLALAAQVRSGAGVLLREAVELATSPTRRAELALSGSRALGLAGYFDEAADLCRAGHRPGDDIPAELSDRVEAELVCMAFLDARTVEEARRRLRGRLASPRPLTALWAYLAAWQSMCDARPAEETLALLAAADPAAIRSQPDSLIGTMGKVVHTAVGQLETAESLCTSLIDLARPRGWQIAFAHGSFLRALALVRAGRIREAVTDGRFALDVKLGNSPPAAIVWSLTSLVDALVEFDALDEADEALAATWALGDPPRDGLGVPIVLEGRGRLRLAQGRHEEAAFDLRAAAGLWDRLEFRHPGLAMWRVGLVEASIALGDRDGALRLAEEHRAAADEVGLPGPRGAALRAVAAATGGRDAVELLEQSARILDGTPERLEQVRTLVALGAALRRVNRRTDARAVLRDALDLAEAGAMRLLARRARQELTATGARPRRNRTCGVDALTPAERRVATLASLGRSNPEIAQELFVTRRTVETHLTHVFQKLEITMRSELSGVLTG